MITHDEQTNRFTTGTDSAGAFLQYRRRADSFVILHTEIPGDEEGHGIGGALMSRLTRGFTGRNRKPNPALPPGQYDTGTRWPVLNAEATPGIDTDAWTFTIDGFVERPTTWTWSQLHALTESTYSGAIHCVTTWSKFDMTFTGVLTDDPFLSITVALPGFSCPTSTSGRARSGSLDYGFSTTTSQDSGNATATTVVETHGSNSTTSFA
jgi:hypothetical protein